MISSIVLIGAPGSGKTEIGKTLAKQTGYNYISSGDIAREMAKVDNNTSSALANGKLAPEEMMRHHLSTTIVQAVCHGGMILDGCPRNIDQYKWLKSIIPNDLTAYVHIDVDLSICTDRLISRMRNDDSRDIINTRLAYYTENIIPMIHIISQEANFIKVSNNLHNMFCSDLIQEIAYEIGKAARYIENSENPTLRPIKYTRH